MVKAMKAPMTAMQKQVPKKSTKGQQTRKAGTKKDKLGERGVVKSLVVANGALAAHGHKLVKSTVFTLERIS